MTGLATGEFTPPAFSTHIDVHPHMPGTDDHGGEFIPEGWLVEILDPGACKWRRLTPAEGGFIPYGKHVGRVPVYNDGQYGIRVIAVSSAGCESEPSEGTDHIVDVVPPAQPEPPWVEKPSCHNGRTRIHFCYPGLDADGNALTRRTGMLIEAAPQGSHEYRVRGQATFPKMHADIDLPIDGTWLVRVIAQGACNKSNPSESTPVPVNRRPPARPEAPEVDTPCVPK